MKKCTPSFPSARLNKGYAFNLLCLLFVAGIVYPLGCSRSQYRASADKKSYSLIASRLVDPRWTLPTRTVEPVQQSRLGLPANLDCAPKPPDDHGPSGFDRTSPSDSAHFQFCIRCHCSHFAFGRWHWNHEYNAG